jgi:putative transposase
MPHGYPIELRARALSFLDSGKSRAETCETFCISSKTLFNWIKRRKETGDVQIKERPKERSHRKLIRESLLAYLEKHPDHYLTEIAESFGVKAPSVFNALKKFGISRKKNDTLLRARRKKEAKIPSRNRKHRS